MGILPWEPMLEGVRTSRARPVAVSIGVAAFLIGSMVVLEGWRAGVREFDVDEFQHVHAAWSWSLGRAGKTACWQTRRPGG